MMNRRNLLTTGIGLAALGAIATQSTRVQAARGPRAGHFPNVTLYTHEGKKVRFYDDLMAHRVVAVNMMYTTCSDRCPPMTANLKQVQAMLGRHVGRDVFMYSITINPEHDTPKELRAYVKEHDIQPGWLYLTGEPKDIEAVRYSIGFYDIDPEVDTDRAQHTGMVRIGNESVDRWAMSAALAKPVRIVEAIESVAMRRFQRA